MWLYELELWKLHQIQEYGFKSSGIWWYEGCYAGSNILDKVPAFVYRAVQAVSD